MGTKPLPSLREIFSKVRQEESKEKKDNDGKSRSYTGVRGINLRDPGIPPKSPPMKTKRRKIIFGMITVENQDTWEKTTKEFMTNPLIESIHATINTSRPILEV